MCPIVGANWNNAGAAGPWAVNLNNVRSNTNNNVVGRADSESPRTGQPDGGAKGGAFWQMGKPTAKSVCIRHSGRLTLEGLTS